MPRYKVIGVCEIAGVATGGEVDLDPSKVNIDVLLRAGHVAPIDETKSAPEAKATPPGKASPEVKNTPERSDG